MHRKVDLAKSSLAQDSTNSVKLAGCWRCLVELFKVDLKHFNELHQVFVEHLLVFVTLFSEVVDL